MLNIKHILLFISVYLGTSSCTKVVDVDVPNGGDRLIIEASINWEKGSTGNQQTILLSLSTPYYSQNKFTPAKNAEVKITNMMTQDSFVFTEEDPGIYTTSNFQPIIDATYKLQVVYNSNTYESTETLKNVSDIKNVTQEIEDIFGTESILVSASVEDPSNEENFYYCEFRDSGNNHLLGRVVDSDELSDGNNLLFEYDDEDIKPEDQMDISIYGVSKGYYNFMNLLLEQSGGSEGGPFSTIPAKLIGNCVNTTNPAEETLGYFRLSVYSKITYTVQ